MDKTAVYLRVAVYIVLYGVPVFLTAPIAVWVGGYFFGITASQAFCAVFANWLALRIYTSLSILDLGLRWSRDAARNLALGLAGGVGAATLVLAPPIAAHLARLAPASDAPTDWASILFTSALLLLGSAGEEILFRGFGFQMLFRVWGPFTTVFTVGALFAVLHGANPNSTYLGLLNTAGFGILFGYAFLRSGDLWLPIGLHFGWNFTLPLFGVNVSGLTMRLTGYEMDWNLGPVWSGGEYGPEGSVLTSIVLLALALYLWKAPVRKTSSCVPGSYLSS